MNYALALESSHHGTFIAPQLSSIVLLYHELELYLVVTPELEHPCILIVGNVLCSRQSAVSLLMRCRILLLIYMVE